jgi:hypothetical protein
MKAQAILIISVLVVAVVGCSKDPSSGSSTYSGKTLGTSIRFEPVIGVAALAETYVEKYEKMLRDSNPVEGLMRADAEQAKKRDSDAFWMSVSGTALLALVIVALMAWVHYSYQPRAKRREGNNPEGHEEPATPTTADAASNHVSCQTPANAGAETCANCGRTIGRLETPHVWQNAIVCAQCRKMLEAEKPA